MRQSKSQTYNLSSGTQVTRRNQGIAVISLGGPATFPQKVFKLRPKPVRAAKRHIVEAPHCRAIPHAALGNLTRSV